jgi:hypothetical protein
MKRIVAHNRLNALHPDNFVAFARDKQGAWQVTQIKEMIRNRTKLRLGQFFGTFDKSTATPRIGELGTEPVNRDRAWCVVMRSVVVDRAERGRATSIRRAEP